MKTENIILSVKNILLYIILFFLIATSASCASNSRNTISEVDSGTQATDEKVGSVIDGVIDNGPVRGGRLKLFCTPPDILNPLFSKNSCMSDVFLCVYEGLTMVGRDLKPAPWLAKGWEVSEDGLAWTFEIRNDVYWHDGKPLTSGDVEQTFRIIKNNPGKTLYFNNIANVDAFVSLDRYHFKVILKRPDSFTSGYMDFPILPAHVFSDSKGDIDEGTLIPGTGPFALVKYDKEKSVLLSRNDNWWASKAIYDKGGMLPYIDEIEFRVGNDTDDAIGFFQTREIDATFINQIEGNRFSGRSDLSFSGYAGNKFEFVAFNTKKTITSDPAVRYAISKIIDRDEVVRDLFPDKAIPAGFPSMPGNWLINTRQDNDEPELEDPDRLLEDNGWKMVNEKLYKRINGKNTQLSLNLVYNNDNPERKIIAGFISNKLAEYGISVNIKAADWNDYKKAMSSGNFDMMLAGCTIRHVPDMSFFYLSNEKPGTADSHFNVWNISGYNNPICTELLKNISLYSDYDIRSSLFNELNLLLLQDVPYIGLFFYKGTVLYSKKIRGIQEPVYWNKYYDIARWYLIKP